MRNERYQVARDRKRDLKKSCDFDHHLPGPDRHAPANRLHQFHLGHEPTVLVPIRPGIYLAQAFYCPSLSATQGHGSIQR